jgi:hypothetical protein
MVQVSTKGEMQAYSEQHESFELLRNAWESQLRSVVTELPYRILVTCQEHGDTYRNCDPY